MKNFLILTLLTLSVSFVGSCKKCDDPCNKSCDNYDPCCNIQNVSAQFRVREGDRGFPPPQAWCDLLPTDTFNSSSVRFDIALGNPETSTYTWQIGQEQFPRTQKGFEIDFSDYLRQGNWESSIPITLTVKTPLNACWANPDDTSITLTRNIFFTQEQVDFWRNDTIVKYKGFASNQANKEKVVTYIRQENKAYKGVLPPVTLIVGFSFIDTLLIPKGNCGSDFCINNKHQIFKFYNVDKCSDSSLSNFLTDLEWIFIERENHIKQIYHFKNSPSIEFSGVKL